MRSTRAEHGSSAARWWQLTAPLPDFSTERLVLRHWAPLLAAPGGRERMADALTPLLTPEVLAPLPPSFALTDGVTAWIEARAAESAVYAVSAAEAELVGLLVLADPEPGALYLGYLFGPAFWGQGLASELVQGLVAEAGAAGIARLVAGVDPGNHASRRVLEKAGFQLRAEAEQGDMQRFERHLAADR